MKFNMLENLFNFTEMRSYKGLAYPSNVKFLTDKLKKKLEEDPDYEVFVPIQYIRLAHLMRTNLFDPIFKPKGWYVSNKGRVLTTVRSKKGKIATVHLQNSCYKEVRHICKEVRTRMLVQRIVACAFIAPDPHIDPSFATVKFKDNDIENVHPSNLYWFER